MSGDRSGSQCGLTSLLPMSCRGRAAAFARDLHSRLRNLGAAHDGDCESSWLARDAGAASPTHRSGTTAPRELDTFYDFELECESPSSPADEFDNPFSERSPVEDTDPPFYDVDDDTELKEQAKQMLQQKEKKKNGFKFTASFFSENSPVKSQPAPRENGHADKRLYSAMTFEGCARQNSQDEIDSVSLPVVPDTDRLSLPLNLGSTLDSDSEFESAKSEPSDDVFTLVNDDVVENGVTDALDNLSLNEVPSITDLSNEEVKTTEIEIPNVEQPTSLEIVTSEVLEEKEVSPAPEIEPSLLSPETVEDQEDAEDDRPQRVRRCSSLKTGKTPPGTPGRKKIVRFADVLGLDLADVKTFMDEIPVIPKSAYDDLTNCDVACSPPARAPQRLGALTLVPLFQLPRDVTDKLERLNVCLESARVCEGVHVSICGSVRVRNLDFHKTVHIRYTMNRWKTYTDLQATYVSGSCDGYSDRFQFMLYAPCISSGQRLEVAVRFQCKGQQFWDNNAGANYCFDCLALGATAACGQGIGGPLHPTVDWHPSFY
ncbi:hypothetical protein O0L34_g16838 [Tuta absoluta]|nr:hypothetical protein O0L34_g16838 [Tuta absoluta]